MACAHHSLTARTLRRCTRAHDPKPHIDFHDQRAAPRTSGVAVSAGKKFRFPQERKLVLDILRAARSVPALPLDRPMALGRLAALRKQCARRISWTAIFLKAWARVSEQVPQLTQCYLSLPWGHLYQHPATVAMITVHRRDAGAAADRLIFCRIKAPHLLTLNEIQECLDRTQHDPLEKAFPDGRLLDRFPWPLRRLVWHLMMHWWGDAKCSQLGTFSISSLAGQNVSNRNHPLILTSSLSFTPLDDAGRCVVSLLCDHRVLDGHLGAECLQQLEAALLGAMCDELSALGRPLERAKVA